MTYPVMRNESPRELASRIRSEGLTAARERAEAARAAAAAELDAAKLSAARERDQLITAAGRAQAAAVTSAQRTYDVTVQAAHDAYRQAVKRAEDQAVAANSEASAVYTNTAAAVESAWRAQDMLMAQRGQ